MSFRSLAFRDVSVVLILWVCSQGLLGLRAFSEGVVQWNVYWIHSAEQSRSAHSDIHQFLN